MNIILILLISACTGDKLLEKQATVTKRHDFVFKEMKFSFIKNINEQYDRLGNMSYRADRLYFRRLFFSNLYNAFYNLNENADKKEFFSKIIIMIDEDLKHNKNHIYTLENDIFNYISKEVENTEVSENKKREEKKRRKEADIRNEYSKIRNVGKSILAVLEKEQSNFENMKNAYLNKKDKLDVEIKYFLQTDEENTKFVLTYINDLIMNMKNFIEDIDEKIINSNFFKEQSLRDTLKPVLIEYFAHINKEAFYLNGVIDKFLEEHGYNEGNGISKTLSKDYVEGLKKSKEYIAEIKANSEK